MADAPVACLSQGPRNTTSRGARTIGCVVVSGALKYRHAKHRRVPAVTDLRRGEDGDSQDRRRLRAVRGRAVSGVVRGRTGWARRDGTDAGAARAAARWCACAHGGAGPRAGVRSRRTCAGRTAPRSGLSQPVGRALRLTAGPAAALTTGAGVGVTLGTECSSLRPTSRRTVLCTRPGDLRPQPPGWSSTRFPRLRSTSASAPDGARGPDPARKRNT